MHLILEGKREMEEHTLSLEDILRAAAPEDKPAIEELIAMLNKGMKP